MQHSLGMPLLDAKNPGMAAGVSRTNTTKMLGLT